MPAFAEERGSGEGRTPLARLREGVRTTLTRLSRTGELPTLAPTAVAAMAIARDPEAGVEQLCRVVRSDVGLSARILRVANSAAYARRVPARTLSDAILTLGLRKTCDLLVAASTRQLFRVIPHHAERLWRHALASALVAEEVGQEVRSPAPHLAFLPGLFHDVGHIAFALSADGEHLPWEGAEGDAGSPRAERERALYGFDHAEAGAILTEDWGLAPEQVDGIRWHHQPEQAEVGRTVAAILNVADWGACTMGFVGAVRAPEEIGRGVLGLTADQVAGAVTRAKAAFAIHAPILG